MAWEQRGPKHSYYYRSVRTPDGPRKRYLGRGLEARLEADRIAQETAAMVAEKQAVEAEQLRTSETVQLTDDLNDLSTLLLEGSLLAAGFWRGRDRRQWRKRRGIKQG